MDEVYIVPNVISEEKYEVVEDIETAIECYDYRWAIDEDDVVITRYMEWDIEPPESVWRLIEHSKKTIDVRDMRSLNQRCLNSVRMMTGTGNMTLDHHNILNCDVINAVVYNFGPGECVLYDDNRARIFHMGDALVMPEIFDNYSTALCVQIPKNTKVFMVGHEM